MIATANTAHRFAADRGRKREEPCPAAQNAYAERVQSAMEECLAKLILLGEGSLRRALCHCETTVMRKEITQAKTTYCYSLCQLKQSVENGKRCGVGLHYLETWPPAGPESVQHNPQEPVAPVEAQATRRVHLANRKLVAKREDLRLQGSTGFENWGLLKRKGRRKESSSWSPP
jgi:hypothetical protein